MSIPVTCPECQSHFHVGDEFAGRPGRCPECTAILQVPDPDAPIEHAEYRRRTRTPTGPSRRRGLQPAPPRSASRAGRNDSSPPPRRRPDDRPRERRFRLARPGRPLGPRPPRARVRPGGRHPRVRLADPPDRPDGRPRRGAAGPERPARQRADRPGVRDRVHDPGRLDVLGARPGGRTPGAVRPGPESARASFIMVLGSIGAFVVTFCLLFADPRGGGPGRGERRRPPPRRSCSSC